MCSTTLQQVVDNIDQVVHFCACKRERLGTVVLLCWNNLPQELKLAEPLVHLKGNFYYSVQFVRKKALAALSVKILKHCIQRNLSMCTRNWQKRITRAPLIVRLVNYIAKDGRQNHQFECFVSQSE